MRSSASQARKPITWANLWEHKSFIFLLLLVYIDIGNCHRTTYYLRLNKNHTLVNYILDKEKNPLYNVIYRTG